MVKKREKFSSVFAAASSIEKKGAPSETTKEETLRIPAVPPPPEQLPPLASPEEFEEQFKRCEEIHKELADKVEKATSVMDKSLTEFRHLIEDPSNFTSQAWTQISKQKTEVDERIEKLVPRKKKEVTEKAAEVKEGKKKGKLTGRRRWISMD